MLLYLFPLLLLIFYLYLLHFLFWLLCVGRNFFSGSVYWSSVGFLYVHEHLFRFGKFSFIILLKIFAGPLICKSSFSSTPIICRFGLLIVSWISWVFWVRILLRFVFSLIVVPMFSMESSSPELLSSISCILLLMLASMVPDFFPRVSISRVSSLWVFFIVSTQCFLCLGWFYSIPSPVWSCFPVIL